MKTLYEEALRTVPGIENAEVIYIQNVADYFCALEEDFVDVMNNIPNVAPPFPCFWMEYRQADRLWDGERMRENDGSFGLRLGFLFKSREVEEGWKTKITVFMKPLGDIMLDYWWFGIDVDREGRLLKRSYHLSDWKIKNLTTDERIEQETEWSGRGYTWTFPALLAVAFLHCKNVELIPHEPRTTKRLARNQPRVRYHTLQIEPMKKILRDEGGSEKTGLKHALHICRGHFKDFTKGNGLFGRYREVYWWDSQVRGSADSGAVLKDYNIKEPVNSV